MVKQITFVQLPKRQGAIAAGQYSNEKNGILLDLIPDSLRTRIKRNHA